MKINSNIFTDAMKYNKIVFENDLAKIHNYDAEGIGVLSKKKIATATEEKIEFTLSEKDYKFISKLGEIDLLVTNKEVKVRSKGNKYKFACLIDVPDFTVDTNELKQLGITYEQLSKFSSFVGDIKTQPQYGGVNILNEVMITSKGGFAIIRRDFKNESGYQINIPKSSIKYIQEHEKLKFMTNGKFLICMTPGRNFYTTLIENKLNNNKIVLDNKYKVNINRTEILNELKMIQDYAEIVKICYKNNKLNLRITTAEQEFDVNVNATNFEGTNIVLNFHIKNLLLILGAIEAEEILLEISDRALRIYDQTKENEFFLTRYGNIEEE